MVSKYKETYKAAKASRLNWDLIAPNWHNLHILETLAQLSLHLIFMKFTIEPNIMLLGSCCTAYIIYQLSLVFAFVYAQSIAQLNICLTLTACCKEHPSSQGTSFGFLNRGIINSIILIQITEILKIWCGKHYIKSDIKTLHSDWCGLNSIPLLRLQHRGCN